MIDNNMIKNKNIVSRLKTHLWFYCCFHRYFPAKNSQTVEYIKNYKILIKSFSMQVRQLTFIC